ncbi:ribosomal-protein-alanine acetyltransferase [Clostridia bacterium]|nr:ribosomal-protein-alanine acetyltransferase [Clostridia bacterium]
MELEFHPMQAADLPAVIQIEKTLFSEPWSEDGFLSALGFDHVLYLTAHWGGEVVAYCGIYCMLDEGELVNMAVKPESQNKGIGKRMLCHLLEQARQKGVTKVFLEVRVSNQPALHLYESLGFMQSGKRKDFYQKPTEDAYVMVKKLP